MKIYDITPLNTYNCQGCFQDFKTDQKYIIEIEFYPVCSKRCEFKVIYRWIKLLSISDENLEFMQKTIEKKDKIIEFNRQKAIFSITKHYANIGLANIKVMGQWDRTKKEGTKKGMMGQWDITSPPIEYRGMSHGMSHPYSKPCPITKTKSKVLKKWF